MVIAEYVLGNTKIRIHDDCMAKTPEENQKIVDRIAALVTRQRQLEAMRGESA